MSCVSALPAKWFASWCGLGLWLLAAATAGAQTPNDWQFERLYVSDGRELAGLLLTENNGRYEFAEFVRPAGKPMYAIVRMVPQEKVTLYRPLPEAEKDLLAERYLTVRHRALIEANRMEDVQFARPTQDNPVLVYDGPWFTVHSTADETTTRRSIVRLEQTFCAYRQLLPPRISQAASFRIDLFGSSREYREAQQRAGWTIAHPAFFAAKQNLVMAGTDLSTFADELTRVSAENTRVYKQLKELTNAFETRLAQTAAEMKRNGFTGDDIETEIRGLRAIWNKQHKQLVDQYNEIEKRNITKFNEFTAALFRRLQHEAFHAYLENYVYPHDQTAVPRWLNEGFAQIFEYAQIDSDTLRVDAPPPELLRELKGYLKETKSLTLEEFLSDDQALLAAHDSREKTSPRHYVYAWGLTYHLAFLKPRLTGTQLTKFVDREASSNPRQRLEELVGKSLPEFEKEWRNDLLNLR